MALAKGLELHHYDLYRLTDPAYVPAELAEDMADPAVITIIEWAGLAGHHLPSDRLTIKFTPTSDTGRHLTFTAGGPRSQRLIQELSS